MKTLRLQHRAVPTRKPSGLRVGRTPFHAPHTYSVHPTTSGTPAPPTGRGKQPQRPLNPGSVNVSEPRPLSPGIVWHHVHRIGTLTTHAGHQVILVLIG